MRSADRALILGAVLFGAAVAPAAAKPRGQTPTPDASRGRAVSAEIPSGGPSIALGRLDDPVRLEQQLRRIIRQGNGTLRLTVPNGRARLGDFAVGQGESVPGDLLVIKGDADLFGRVGGSVVTLDDEEVGVALD